MFNTRINLLMALIFNLIWVSNAQTMKKMETNFNEQQKEVYRTIEKMVTAFESKDIDGVLSTYEEDAIVMFEPGNPITGHNALRQAFTEFVSFNPNYTFSSHEVYISGDIATHIAPWKMVGTLPDGNKIEQNGLSVAILRKQSNGNWLMIQDNPHGQFHLNN
ncbi:hypothetical protein GCM10009430_46020 [Aquimarina litoralis]|uniref:SnoaL-like domain-containing protein n=2 Tax=Aquimarina litoralis TaxID=584605 RepID=A0ABN1J928_9FLAO